eukprot:symbB.v1.2.005071.t1/scaffold292.1/size239810/15
MMWTRHNWPWKKMNLKGGTCNYNLPWAFYLSASSMQPFVCGYPEILMALATTSSSPGNYPKCWDSARQIASDDYVAVPQAMMQLNQMRIKMPSHQQLHAPGGKVPALPTSLAPRARWTRWSRPFPEIGPWGTSFQSAQLADRFFVWERSYALENMIPPPQANGYQAQGASPFEDWVTHVNTAKRKIRSELSQKYGFGHRRAAEFDALSNVLENGLVPREKRDQLSVEEFWEKYEKPGKPCLIYGVPEKEGWACERWKWEDFFTRFGQSHFKVGKDDHGQTVRLRADYFEQYSRTQQDDSPVYLFDNHFKHEKKAILEDYHVPSYFPDDYMSLCDDRPPYRWVGVGPRRSGTIMHQDPLCTSAWNTLLLGRKLWLLLPPNTPKREPWNRELSVDLGVRLIDLQGLTTFPSK